MRRLTKTRNKKNWGREDKEKIRKKKKEEKKKEKKRRRRRRSRRRSRRRRRREGMANTEDHVEEQFEKTTIEDVGQMMKQEVGSVANLSDVGKEEEDFEDGRCQRRESGKTRRREECQDEEEKVGERR